MSTPFEGFLGGLRVLEVGEELGEYCGKVLAGLGADVVRVEPREGSLTRSYGPFEGDVQDRERSLHFWHYNLGKRSLVLDLDDPADQDALRELAAHADVVLDSRPRGFLSERGIGADALRALNPSLVYARISAFGDTGPWADFEGSDLVHLALGGVMMNCGYDPEPSGFYDTPPIAPQMWHAYAIAGELMAMSVVAALVHRLDSGRGQHLSLSVHEAVSKNTETDLPDWVFLGQTHRRLTARHSATVRSAPTLSMTKDGRYLLPYRTYLKNGPNAWDGTVALLKSLGAAEDLEDAKYDGDGRTTPEATDRIARLTDDVVSRLVYDRDLWRDAQGFGLPWAPVRRPEENVQDEHWRARGTFVEVFHPELDRAVTYMGGKWVTEGLAWPTPSRPALLGEHTEEVRKEWSEPRVPHRRLLPSLPVKENSVHGKPFALNGVRVIDLSWMLASAGAGRFLAAMGADVIKVEHLSRPDIMRFSRGSCPPGGRAEREAATAPLPTPVETLEPNRGGAFMEINAGKSSLSLNLKHPEAMRILEDLIRDADMVVEGFSPGTMTRMGLSYERLKELNPRIIYVQQSGFGEAGTYGRAKAYGPTAQAITGLTDMSGLPDPYPPAGIGYSYLDWFGAYNMALAMLAALYRREVTGEGSHIDASQAETGLFLTGTAILDHTVNGRRWSRYGNRSPHKPAAPHGAYRTQGDDRWIAVSAFTEAQWQSLVEVLGSPSWAADKRFATLDRRIDNQDVLDELLDQTTQEHDPFALMQSLQRQGVPAGVCQNARDRFEDDPQLAHLEWLVELPQTEIGTWPVKEHPVRFSETPTHIGGRLQRSGPNYGEDTDRLLRELLSLDPLTIQKLRHDGAL